MLNNWLSERGFTQLYNIAGITSISALLRNTNTCGIYILHFANDEHYVGLAKNVIRRYSQHKRNHIDIEQISFKPVALQALKQVETSDIDFFKIRLRLRNIDGMEDIIMERSVDKIILPDNAEIFLNDIYFNDTTGEKYSNNILQSNYRYRKLFYELTQAPFYSEILAAARKYVLTCIPMPVKTEYAFWSITCFPLKLLNKSSIVLRLNIYQQEVFTVYYTNLEGTETTLDYSFQLAKSPLQEVINNRTNIERIERLFPSASFDDHYYRTGGKDQFRLSILSDDIQRILDLPEFIRSVRLHNLRLMRKGTNMNRVSHCMDFSEQLLKFK